MAAEPLQGYPYPASTAAADVPADLQALALYAAPRSVMVFASAAARTAAFAAAGISPAAGMLSYRQDASISSNGFEYYNASASAWRVDGSYIDRVEPGSATGSMTISGIPSYLRRLSLRCVARGDTAAVSTQVSLRIASDSTAVYRSAIRFMQNQATSPTSANAGANVSVGQTSALVGYITAATAGVGYGVIDIEVDGWNAPHGTYLAGTTRGGYLDSTANSITIDGHWAYSGSNAYTSVTLIPQAGNFIAGSQFTLIGSE
jgi:hypothetical protein